MSQIVRPTEAADCFLYHMVRFLLAEFLWKIERVGGEVLGCCEGEMRGGGGGEGDVQ